MPSFIDLTGHTYGELAVLSRATTRSGGGTFWLVRCSCGLEKIVRGYNLRSGASASCGHLQADRRKAINDRFVERCAKERAAIGIDGDQIGDAPEYCAWSAMKQRCLNERVSSYPHYGGRGITICERWKDSFANFYADMGPRPSRKHSLDRIDVDGNYEPGNCKWATASEQRRNQRSVAKLERQNAVLRKALQELVRCIRGGDKTAGFSMDDALYEADELLIQARNAKAEKLAARKRAA